MMDETFWKQSLYVSVLPAVLKALDPYIDIHKNGGNLLMEVKCNIIKLYFGDKYFSVESLLHDEGTLNLRFTLEPRFADGGGQVRFGLNRFISVVEASSKRFDLIESEVQVAMGEVCEAAADGLYA